MKLTMKRTNLHDWKILTFGGEEVLVCRECHLTLAETLEQLKPAECWGDNLE
jgi:hypothetical protein